MTRRPRNGVSSAGNVNIIDRDFIPTKEINKRKMFDFLNDVTVLIFVLSVSALNKNVQLKTLIKNIY